jgi:hypothetical protein
MGLAGRTKRLGRQWRSAAPPLHGFASGTPEKALKQPLSGVPQTLRKLDGHQEAHRIALACSSPPEGQARWTLRLLADPMVELEYVEALS